MQKSRSNKPRRTMAQRPHRAGMQRQQRALDAMFAAVDKLPQASRNDGLSNRDHDQILYGSPQ